MSFLETIRQVITPGASQMARRGRAGVKGQSTLMKSRSNGKWQTAKFKWFAIAQLENYK
jgi:hypothetical protein